MYHTRSGSVLTTDKVLTIDEQEHLVARCHQMIRLTEATTLPNRCRDGDSRNFSDPYKHGFRDPLMVLLMLECGLRNGEVLGLLAGDFRPDRQTLFIRTKKGGRARELPLNENTCTYLQTWLLRRSGAKNLAEVPPTLRICNQIAGSAATLPVILSP